MANAGFVAEQPAYTSVSYAAPAVKTAVVSQPIAYHSAPHSASYTKTVSYSAPKAYVAQPSYHSYEPAHQYVSSYHHEPSHHVYAAPAVYGHHYEHGSSEQNIVRSAHGTVSHISKAVDTPHSSVRKYDTRVINDGYKTVQYAHAQPAYQYVQPEVHSVVAQPVLAKTVAHVAQPVVAKTVAHVAQPTTYVAHQPTAYVSQPSYAHQYAAHAPVVASKVHYSPAIEVAHASFESPVAHYSW